MGTHNPEEGLNWPKRQWKVCSLPNIVYTKIHLKIHLLRHLTGIQVFRS